MMDLCFGNEAREKQKGGLMISYNLTATLQLIENRFTKSDTKLI